MDAGDRLGQHTQNAVSSRRIRSGALVSLGFKCDSAMAGDDER